MPSDHAQTGVGVRGKMQVRVRIKSMPAAAFEVLDLSLAGCMIEIGGWNFREEQRVFVSLPNSANVPATVLWVDSGRAGLLFDDLLNEAVHEHLVQGYALRGCD